MIEHTCERCHYSTMFRNDLKKHFNKKIPCQAIYSQISCQDLLEKLTKLKEHKCDCCDKSYSYLSTLTRHKKGVHAEHLLTLENSNNQSNSNNISTSQSYNTSHSHNTTTTTHNNTNSNNIINNPTININLNVFGQEELQHILEDEDLLLHCLKNAKTTGIPTLIRKIWCNEDVPENNNVQLKRQHKPKLVSVYMKEGEDNEPKWIKQDANVIIDQMIEKGTKLLVMHNSKIYNLYCEEEEKNVSDDERFDKRNETLTNIKCKKRGYGKHRDHAMSELRKFKEKQ